MICRAGRLFGADAKGRVYTGELRSHDLGRQSSILLGNYEGPLRGSARALGDRNSSPGRFPLRAEIDPLASRQSGTVRVGGLEVEVEINYLGPLPP